MNSLCVFCGSSPGINGSYAQSARNFGELLVSKNITLVFGGGKVGLMGQLADAVLSRGGKAVGVIPDSLVKKEVAHTGLTRLHVVQTMHERKALMYELSDGFVALPGGAGTLDEVFEVFTWIQLGHLRKPVGMLNVDGYFDSLVDFLHHAVRQRFLKQEHLDLLHVDRKPEELLHRLHNGQIPQMDKWL